MVDNIPPDPKFNVLPELTVRFPVKVEVVLLKVGHAMVLAVVSVFEKTTLPVPLRIPPAPTGV